MLTRHASWTRLEMRLPEHAYAPRGFAAGDTNLYRYVGNAPTNATDPSGLEDNAFTTKTVKGFDFAWTMEYKRVKDEKHGFPRLKVRLAFDYSGGLTSKEIDFLQFVSKVEYFGPGKPLGKWIEATERNAVDRRREGLWSLDGAEGATSPYDPGRWPTREIGQTGIYLAPEKGREGGKNPKNRPAIKLDEPGANYNVRMSFYTFAVSTEKGSVSEGHIFGAVRWGFSIFNGTIDNIDEPEVTVHRSVSLRGQRLSAFRLVRYERFPSPEISFHDD